MHRPYRVCAEWDPEAAVWITTSDDVPGLCAQASAFGQLVTIAHDLVPELLLANGVIESGEAIDPW